jgi:hypothetical protein
MHDSGASRRGNVDACSDIIACDKREAPAQSEWSAHNYTAEISAPAGR